MAVASAGPYASLHLAPDRQPRQHPTTQFLQAGCPSCRPTNSVKALKAVALKASPVSPKCDSKACLYVSIRYDTRCYFNVRSKADISQLNLSHYVSMMMMMMMMNHAREGSGRKFTGGGVVVKQLEQADVGGFLGELGQRLVPTYRDPAPRPQQALHRSHVLTFHCTAAWRIGDAPGCVTMPYTGADRRSTLQPHGASVMPTGASLCRILKRHDTIRYEMIF